MDFEFIGIEQAAEITKKTEEVAESYAEACNALREASKKVSELQAILPPDMCIRLSDEFVGSFPLPGFRLPYEIRALPTHLHVVNGDGNGVVSQRTAVFGNGKGHVGSSDLNQISNSDNRAKKRHKRTDDRKRPERHSPNSESSTTDTNQPSKNIKRLQHQDQSPVESKSIVLKTSPTKGKPAKTTKISSSAPFTQEETTFLNEFIACVDRRLADKLSRQRDIAEEIRAMSNNECTISQSTVSKMMRRFTVPRDQVTFAAVRNWIDAQPPPAEVKQEE